MKAHITKEPADICEYYTHRMELRMSAVLWKSDSMTAVLTVQNIGLKVR